jgi:polar amino acid transport system substrate-binding protein
VLLALAACGSSNDSASSKAAPATTAATCTAAQLKTLAAGKLTIGTDSPAYPPYFVDNKPTNGKGFESAVGYAVAKELGYAPTAVSWKIIPFDASYAPGPKKFDFDVNEVSITAPRQKVVDFSAPYYAAPQAIVALDKDTASKATTLADLQSTKFGAQVGTTSLSALQAALPSGKQPQVFNNSNDVVEALKVGRVDAIAVDLPTAFYLTSAELDNAKIVGTLPGGTGDTWGAVLAKNSPLTTCVSQAVNKLRTSGELQKITNRWMGGGAGVKSLS